MLRKRCNLYGSTRSWTGDFPLKILGGGCGGVCQKYLKTSLGGSYGGPEGSHMQIKSVAANYKILPAN